MKLQKLGGIAAIASVCMTIAYYMFFSLTQEKLGLPFLNSCLKSWI